jgi:electron transfer flavoprotein alpha subunit
MSVLIVAEHDNASLKPASLNVVAAAAAIDSEIHFLVAGWGCSAVADQAANVSGVGKVLLADSPEYEHGAAENLTPLVAELAPAYSHVLAAATTFGKGLIPRVAAVLDVQPISDISGVEAPDTFIRPIYAGNALATVQSGDPIKVITVRTTAFDAAPADGGTAPTENRHDFHPYGDFLETFDAQNVV